MTQFHDPRKTFGAAVFDAAKADPRIVVVSADSGGSSGFGEFKKTLPGRYIEVGIAEQSAVGVAAGLATTGKIPVFCTIAPFATARPFEMVRNDVGYMRQNVKIVGRNGGFTYSDLGATHHSLEDIAIMRMIPGMTVLMPQDGPEIIAAVDAMLAHNGPVYMRIGNAPMPQIFDPAPFVIGKGRVICEGSTNVNARVAIISTGSVTAAAIEAADMLRAQGVSVMLVGMPTVEPLDGALVELAAEFAGRIVTVEEHYVRGGLFGAVSEYCALNCPVPVHPIGVPHTYASSGTYGGLLKYYGLDAEGIARAAMEYAG